MERKGRRIVIMVALALVLSLSGLPALAQEKPADNMQLVWEKIRADKKLFVSENMGLTESEAKAFWPVYDSYQKDWMKLNDRAIAVIKDYADNYNSMTNDKAKKLIDEYVGIQADQQKMRESYLPKFRKVLPEIKVARYYQLENKISAVVNYELARNIPLVK
ncbi:MAG TPA: hypothetical protein VKF36_21770 [Syntrophorhabdales bacterium]|nr:hypothetical protein [Syntrophorhabdales bacterium]